MNKPHVYVDEGGYVCIPIESIEFVSDEAKQLYLDWLEEEQLRYELGDGYIDCSR